MSSHTQDCTGAETAPGGREIHLEIDAARLRAKPSALLASAAGLAQSSVKDAMAKGAVWLSRGRGTRRLRRHAGELRLGDRLHLYYDSQVLAEQPPPPLLLADEGDYTVWHKPYGMRSQGSRWGDHTTLGRWAELRLSPQRPAFTIHRLDRAASGLMLLAHGKRAAAALSALFRERAIEKRYQVVVRGRLPAGCRELRIDTPLDARTAVSHLRLLQTRNDPEHSLLEVRIETGRKHQIRRHLAGIGLPVLGDRLYDPDGPNAEVDLMLTAVRLDFRCPLTSASRHYALPEELRPQLGPYPRPTPADGTPGCPVTHSPWMPGVG